MSDCSLLFIFMKQMDYLHPKNSSYFKISYSYTKVAIVMVYCDYFKYQKLYLLATFTQFTL